MFIGLGKQSWVRAGWFGGFKGHESCDQSFKGGAVTDHDSNMRNMCKKSHRKSSGGGALSVRRLSRGGVLQRATLNVEVRPVI